MQRSTITQETSIIIRKEFVDPKGFQHAGLHAIICDGSVVFRMVTQSSGPPHSSVRQLSIIWRLISKRSNGAEVPPVLPFHVAYQIKAHVQARFHGL